MAEGYGRITTKTSVKEISAPYLEMAKLSSYLAKVAHYLKFLHCFAAFYITQHSVCY